MKRIKLFKILGIISLCLLIVSTFMVNYSIYLYNGVETFYRMIGIAIIFLITLLIIIITISSIKKLKKKSFIITSIISIILAIIYFILGYLLITAYSKLDDFNKTTITHKTALVSLQEKELKNIKIGMIDDEENIEGYILPMEYIENNSLEDTNKIVYYTDSLTMMHDLYEGVIDAIFISYNYPNMFESIEGYENIRKETIVLKTYEKEYKKEEIEESTSDNIDTLTEPITLLLLGVDSEKDGLDKNASFNGDTIMLITFNPKTLNATLFSIPRDTYVTMACGGSFQKINHAAWGGSSCMVKTVEKLTGIDIDYYVKINFKGVVDLVDALGGIDVTVPEPDYLDKICANDSSRDRHICLEPGYQTLNGEQALVLARNRKAFLQGDFQRGQNQQLVVEAIIQKAKTIRSVTQFYEILDAISKNIDTNMSTDEILSFYNIGKSLMFSNTNNIVNIQKTFLTGYSLNVYEGGSYNTYTFQYYKGSLNEIIELMEINLGLKEKTPIKTFSFSINNLYEKPIAGYTYYYDEPKYSLVPDFTTYTVDEARTWGNRNGITININYTSEGTGENGDIISQSVHKDKMVIKIGKEITLTVLQKEETPPIENDNNDNNENNESNEDESNTGNENIETPSDITPSDTSDENQE